MSAFDADDRELLPAQVNVLAPAHVVLAAAYIRASVCSLGKPTVCEIKTFVKFAPNVNPLEGIFTDVELKRYSLVNLDDVDKVPVNGLEFASRKVNDILSIDPMMPELSLLK